MKNKQLSSQRVIYGKTLVELGEKNSKIVVLDADLSKSTKTIYFHKKFPERFFDMGISEADMVNTAAGISSCGFTVFASTFAMFLTGRAWEQIRNTIAYGNFNVKLVATHAGLSVGPDGSSHQALEDIAIISAIPQINIAAPSDSYSTRQLIIQASEIKEPFYIRLPRCKSFDIYENEKITLGKANILKEGEDLTLISYGLLTNSCLEAHEILKENNINARVIDMHTIRPLDKEIIIKAAKETKRIIVAEEHSIVGGLGSIIATLLSKIYPVKMDYISIQNEFGKSGNKDELFSEYKLTVEDIVKKSKELLK